ncbi:HlyD family secretion protein [Flagellimonas eckloniae]|uniref:Hemolysin D n=1 Tax=Flagellimonas eckloniae TaxID=346185 RepID=A0A0Q1CE22_9FLAO|nr:HlyD family efflux transporter periplasmic adaptor subunit [Allomuricauda eckloniae]KQC28975.1 hemolysin D [Allomuricauda eckloniae]
MPNNIELRSEEVQEILSFVPNWMIRWGNTLIFILFIGLLLMSWFIKYPDTIQAEVIITTTLPPEKVYAASGGQLEAILVKNNDFVTKGTFLGIIENTSNYEDVLLLKQIVDTLKIDYKDFYFPIEQIPILFLGDLESEYALFEQSYTEYILNKDLDPFSNESSTNKLSIQEAKTRLNILVSQQALNKSELNLKQKDFERFKLLFEKGAISAQELDQKQLEYLQAQRSFQNIEASISQLRETIYASRNSLKNTEFKKTRDESSLLKKTIQSYNQLKKSIKNWELHYALKSSISGQVSLLNFNNENQTVNAGDLVFTIIPQGYQNYIGKIKAPAQNSGKIKPGQDVKIRLANYPYTEFGVLEGNIKNISMVTDVDGNYLIDVSLPKKLITTYNIEIDFKQEMIGSVEIITEDLRLIERFFYQFKSIFTR